MKNLRLMLSFFMFLIINCFANVVNAQEQSTVIYSQKDMSTEYHQIFKYNWTTGIITQITYTQYDHFEVSLSPSKQQVVFVGNEDEDYDIFVLNLNSNILTKLTNNTILDTEPTWSPDSNFVAYTESTPLGRRIVYTNLNTLVSTYLTEASLDASLPDWSSNNKIVFQTGKIQDRTIRVIDLSTMIETTVLTGEYFFPTWSNDSTKIIVQKPIDDYYIYDFSTNNLTFVKRFGDVSNFSWYGSNSILFNQIDQGLIVLNLSTLTEANLGLYLPIYDLSEVDIDIDSAVNFVPLATPTPSPTFTSTPTPFPTPAATCKQHDCVGQ